MHRSSAHPAILRSLAAAFLLLGGATTAAACGEVFRGDMVTAEREVGATDTGESATFHVLGAGWFHAAEIVKHGGSSDDTAARAAPLCDRVIVAARGRACRAVAGE